MVSAVGGTTVMISAEVFHLRIKFNSNKNYELRIRTLN